MDEETKEILQAVLFLADLPLGHETPGVHDDFDLDLLIGAARSYVRVKKLRRS